MLESRTDSATPAGQWQADPMDLVVVIVLILALCAIVAAALMTIAVAMSRKKQG